MLFLNLLYLPLLFLLLLYLLPLLYLKLILIALIVVVLAVVVLAAVAYAVVLKIVVISTCRFFCCFHCTCCCCTYSCCCTCTLAAFVLTVVAVLDAVFELTVVGLLANFVVALVQSHYLVGATEIFYLGRERLTEYIILPHETFSDAFCFIFFCSILNQPCLFFPQKKLDNVKYNGIAFLVNTYPIQPIRPHHRRKSDYKVTNFLSHRSNSQEKRLPRLSANQ